jgi:hypothetical protein
LAGGSIALKSHTIKARLVFSHAKVAETASAPAAALVAAAMPNWVEHASPRLLFIRRK